MADIPVSSYITFSFLTSTSWSLQSSASRIKDIEDLAEGKDRLPHATGRAKRISALVAASPLKNDSRCMINEARISNETGTRRSSPSRGAAGKIENQGDKLFGRERGYREEGRCATAVCFPDPPSPPSGGVCIMGLFQRSGGPIFPGGMERGQNCTSTRPSLVLA